MEYAYSVEGPAYLRTKIWWGMKPVSFLGILRIVSLWELL